VNGQVDLWIRRTTIGCVAVLALIAGTVSYLHVLVEQHGQPGWVAALTPLSVDGVIVAASTTLLAESRSGARGGLLPWGILVAGSVASLAANVAVAEPTAMGRVIAARPSFALIGSYELLMRHIRATAAAASGRRRIAQGSASRASSAGPATGMPIGAAPARRSFRTRGGNLREEALRWAIANRSEDGKLPSGKAIGEQFDRQERSGPPGQTAWRRSSGQHEHGRCSRITPRPASGLCESGHLRDWYEADARNFLV
jgi:hypothetical protein